MPGRTLQLRAAQKAELRAEVCRQRDALAPARRRQLSARACARLMSVPAMARAGVVAAYRAFGSEADPAAAFVGDRGPAVVAWPRVGARAWACGPRLRFHVWPPERSWIPGRFGIFEPPALAAEIPACALDAIVVPGVAFDGSGRRMGYGGGYYDEVAAHVRKATRTVLVGFAFSCQVVARIPVEAHDQRVDFLVTDEAVWAFDRDVGVAGRPAAPMVEEQTA